jgi:hypothetical protein
MFGPKGGRLTAIIINLAGTILTIYLLLQFDTVLYALMIILFSLSVSATQCRRRLIITVPVLFTNIGVVIAGIPVSLYMLFETSSSASATTSSWGEPVTIMLFSLICLLNALIIRNLHFSKQGNSPA